MNYKQLPTLTSGELDTLLKEILQRELKEWKEEGLIIRCVGTLENLKAKRDAENGRWSKLFGVMLNASGTLYINAQKDLLSDFEDGDYVEVIGYPAINVYQGRVSVQFEVLEAKFAEGSEEQAQRRSSQASIARLSSLKPVRNPFPLRTSASLDLIYSRASDAQVDADFKNGLGEQAERCIIKAIPVRITSVAEIAQAIQESTADILAIIRGGGPESDFQVFNDDLVLRALSEKSSYRVVGIGHSANTTLVDLIADYSATTPAEAGIHIRDQFRQVASLTRWLEAELENSQEEVEILQAELDSAKQEAKAQTDLLHENYKRQSQAPTQKNNSRFLNSAAILIILALVLALYLSDTNIIEVVSELLFKERD